MHISYEWNLKSNNMFQIDIDNFTEKYADIKWLEAKMAKTGKAGARALRPQKRKQVTV